MTIPETLGNSTIAAYSLPLGNNPDVPPSGTFTSGSLANSQGIAIDSKGNVYVSQASGPSIDVFPPRSSGTPTPSSSISGSNTTLANPSLIAVDSKPNIYVADPGSSGSCAGEVATFAGNAKGNVAPTANIVCQNNGNNNPLLQTPLGVAIDSHGYIYVTNAKFPSVSIFSPGSNGNVAPVAMIVGGNPSCGVLGNAPACCSNMSCPDNTQLGDPFGIAIDALGNIYVTNGGGPPGPAAYSVTIYPPLDSSTGVLNESPTATITGPNTLLNVPAGIAVDASGNIYVANLEAGHTNNITVYSPLSDRTGTLNETPITTLNTEQFIAGSPAGLAIGKFIPPGF
jgi:hypothetical protein